VRKYLWLVIGLLCPLTLLSQTNVLRQTGALTTTCSTANSTCSGTPGSALDILVGGPQAIGYPTALVSISGTYSGSTVFFEISDDGGTTYFPVLCVRTDSTKQENTEALANNSTIALDCPTPSAYRFRVRLSAITSGTVNVGITMSMSPIGTRGDSSVTAIQASGSNLHVDCDSGCSSSAGFADNSAFTVGITPVNPIGGLYDTGADPAISNGNAGRARIDSHSYLYTDCVVGCSGGSTTPSDAFANPTTAGLQFDLLAAFNGTTWDRLRVDSSKNLLVSVNAALPAGANVIGAVTQSGTWTVQQGNAPWSIVGTLTNNNAAPGANNLGVLPCLAGSSAPSNTTGDQVLLSCDLSGNIRVVIPGTVAISAASLPLPSGAATSANQCGASTPCEVSKDTSANSATDPIFAEPTDGTAAMGAMANFGTSPGAVKALNSNAACFVGTTACPTDGTAGVQAVGGHLGDNGSAATTNRAPVLPGIAESNMPSAATAGRDTALRTDLQGNGLMAQVPETSIASYKANKLGLAVAASATDIAVLPGNATNTVIVTGVKISCTQTTAGIVQLQLIQRTTADTSGTSAAMTAVKNDTSNASAVSAPLTYTANPTVNSTVGNYDAVWLGCMAAGTASPNDIYIWRPGMGQSIVLRGTAQQLAVNLNGATVTGGSFDITFEWMETTGL
jgi:hypothetical protein